MLHHLFKSSPNELVSLLVFVVALNKKKIHFRKFYLTFLSCTGLISHQWLDFRWAFSMSAGPGCLKFINWLRWSYKVYKKVFVMKNIKFKNPKIGPTWPRNHCGGRLQPAGHLDRREGRTGPVKGEG